MTDNFEHLAIVEEQRAAQPAEPEVPGPRDSAFLGAAACAVSTVYLNTRSLVATVAVAAVAAFLARRPSRGR